MRGNISRRGKNSWRLKFDVGADAVGSRKTRYVTVKGKRQAAQRELTRLLAAEDAGTLSQPSKVTVAEYVRAWLGGSHGLSPKTAERYRELAEQQIIPHLGHIALTKLKPAEVAKWHGILLRSGGKKGPPALRPHRRSRPSRATQGPTALHRDRDACPQRCFRSGRRKSRLLRLRSSTPSKSQSF